MENKKTEQKKEKTIQEIYKEQLAGELCKAYDEMNIDAFNKLIRSTCEKLNNKFITDKSVQRIAKEIISHSKSLPLEYGSSIFYRYNSENMKFHEFVIAGPEGTPYDSGCFHFRMYCPANYPDTNPMVNIYTTGDGTVRFNPNLYADGKVCLSILGTYSAQKGESWIPGTSTMMQIMISIQSLVMIPDPYFNEPGYEVDYGKPNGIEASKKYNYSVRLNCMKWAMIDMIKNPTKGFENAILTHFKLKAPYIKENCARWVSEAPDKMKNEYEETYQKLCTELDALTGTKPGTETITSEPQTKTGTERRTKPKNTKIISV